ncbi:MAG: HAD family phosphatase [Rhodospirillales bacterium]|nr:HAD family phosphatase [Rhodospirillales bacterium]
MIRSPRIQAVLWDVDGTLVDSEPLHQAAIAAPFRHVGIPAPENLHEETIGKTAETIYAWFRREAGSEMSFEAWRDIKNDFYFSNAGMLEPRDGALAALTDFVRAGLKTAFVSNAERLILETNLRALGLKREDGLSVSCDDVARAKPHPEPYLFAARRLGVEPSRAAVVEDSVEGAAAGVAAGMETYLVPQLSIDPPPGAKLVADFSELTKILLHT